ncbi:MAG: hypothetical protein GYA17_01050, partial [Chloroflexi bacterium]|nr:hypothetical protein [Chloroflexota bacterium]
YFEQQAGGKDYFVVTSLDELDQQPELRQYLYQHFAVLHDSDDYLIFDMRQPAVPMGSDGR